MLPECYKTDLTVGSLMVREARIIAGLQLEGVSQDEWQHAIELENVLQKRSVATAKRQARVLRLRLDCLSPAFKQLLRDGDEELATQVAFCAAVARNRILQEFIE